MSCSVIPPPGTGRFVRWWWNGNKVEPGEIVRELRLLKASGIGGVEINPVAFPSRFEGDDIGRPSLRWLSKEWSEMLLVAFEETKRLGMTCDLIVGSGLALWLGRAFRQRVVTVLL